MPLLRSGAFQKLSLENRSAEDIPRIDALQGNLESEAANRS